MSKWVCSYCIATNGLRGSDLDKWPDQEDTKAITDHIESQHHIPVQQEGETQEQTMTRFKREQPEAGGPNCKCPKCKRDSREALVEMIREFKSHEHRR